MPLELVCALPLNEIFNAGAEVAVSAVVALADRTAGAVRLSARGEGEVGDVGVGDADVVGPALPESVLCCCSSDSNDRHHNATE